MNTWEKVDNTLIYYTSNNLTKTGLVKQLFTTRMGGVSGGEFASLNTGLATCDDTDSVLRNRRIVADVLDVKAEEIIVPEQVHSDNVEVVDFDDAGSGALDHSTAIPQCDALITNKSGVMLVLHFADCVPVYLLAPEEKAIGLVHAGWKGIAQNIVQKTVDAMEKNFYCFPNTLIAAVGPCIDVCCYEVGRDTAESLIEAVEGNRQIITRQERVLYADLKLAVKLQLINAGIDENNISISSQCTCCNSTEFFSYRRDGDCGRMSAWFGLK
ncbi:MAG: peptidoglycan editing factor PgeF [Armatimonadota bacterium]